MNERSKIGVAEVITYLENKGRTVVDTQGNKVYQDIDIDIIIDGFRKGEVKTDFYMDKAAFKNMYCEYTSCVEVDSEGWLRKSKADFIFYIEYREGRQSICHIVNLSELISFIEYKGYKLLNHKDKHENKSKEVFLVPIRDLKTLDSYACITLNEFVA